MSLSDKLVKLAEVAQALDRSEDWVKRNWLKLHLEKGMPRKLTVGWSWPRATLERWLEQGADGVPRELPIDETPSPETPAAPLALIIANQNTRLRDRYAGGRA
jgi:hypothetical protein